MRDTWSLWDTLCPNDLAGPIRHRVSHRRLISKCPFIVIALTGIINSCIYIYV